MNGLRFRSATDADRDAWQWLLDRSSSGDFLHDWAWGAVADYDGEPPRRYLLESDGEPLVLCAPQVRRGVLGRSFWYVPHGPVLDLRQRRARSLLRATVAGLREEARADGAVTVMFEPRVEAGADEARLFRGAGLRPPDTGLQVAQTRLVDLDRNDDALLASFDKDTRYAIRRAVREGVGITVNANHHDRAPVDRLVELIRITQQRAGFPMHDAKRYRVTWRSFAAEGRARIIEAWLDEQLLASGMLVVIGDRSFYLFAGSVREERGAPKRYATYALQWRMMQTARGMGSHCHDLWGIAPIGAGREHPWYGVGLFKKGFGGRAVVWAGRYDLVVQPTLYTLREAIKRMRSWTAKMRASAAR